MTLAEAQACFDALTAAVGFAAVDYVNSMAVYQTINRTGNSSSAVLTNDDAWTYTEADEGWKDRDYADVKHPRSY